MIKVIVANGVVVECELSELAEVIRTVTVTEQDPEPAPVPEKPRKNATTLAATFKGWNIGDQISSKNLWYGSGKIFVEDREWDTGFVGFMAFLRSRNPERGATREELWDLFRFMPWTHSTFKQLLSLLRHEHGWVYENEDRVYIATK
jgi:hypothetical protein